MLTQTSLKTYGNECNPWVLKKDLRFGQSIGEVHPHGSLANMHIQYNIHIYIYLSVCVYRYQCIQIYIYIYIYIHYHTLILYTVYVEYIIYITTNYERMHIQYLAVTTSEQPLEGCRSPWEVARPEGLAAPGRGGSVISKGDRKMMGNGGDLT